ncbi:hypothetical protein HD806DRAFT_540168 [Xylariaceae sp. AK1471]|nr:hypothetical protein HD806DRAFT_540168 [Xylariaceae sp. AK1471]
MSSSAAQQYYSYFLTAFPCLIGTLLLYSGFVGTFISPLYWAKGFGLPTATKENVVLFPSATGRNLGAGFFVWTMILLGERKILGIFFICWAWAGVADTKILLEHPQGTNRGIHARNTVILLILGPLLIRSSSSL